MQFTFFSVAARTCLRPRGACFVIAPCPSLHLREQSGGVVLQVLVVAQHVVARHSIAEIALDAGIFDFLAGAAPNPFGSAKCRLKVRAVRQRYRAIGQRYKGRWLTIRLEKIMEVSEV